MIRITYEFATESEALGFLTGHQPVAALDATPEQAPAARRGRPPKAAAPALQAESHKDEALASAAPQTTTPQPEPVAAAPKVPNQPVQAVAGLNADGARKALRDVFDKKGGTAATTLLKQFGAARVSDIKPEDFAKFVAGCELALKV
jgi:hypothetical protein